MSLPKLKLTEAGAALYAKALAGAELKLTRMALGSGAPSGEDWTQVTAMGTQRASLPLSSYRRSGSTMLVYGSLALGTVTEAFELTELGIFADDGGTEILYGYTYHPSSGGRFDPSTVTGDLQLGINVAVGNAENVTVAVDTSLTFIPISDKGIPFGVATLDKDGKVEAEQMPAMDYDPAGSAAAVQEKLNAHTNDKSNPHGVTAQQVGAAEASHTHDAANIVSGILPVEFGGTGAAAHTSGNVLFGNGTGAIASNTPLVTSNKLGLGYGTCTTAAATVAKVGTLSNFIRRTGAVVSIKFTYANTATNPTLNVNSTGAAYIYNYMTGTYIAEGDISAGMVAHLMYNGSQWVLLNPFTSPMKIERSSYIGTGTSTWTIAYSFVPDMLIVYAKDLSNIAVYYAPIIYKATAIHLYGTGEPIRLSWTDSIVTLTATYNSGASFWNHSGIEYAVVAMKFGG